MQLNMVNLGCYICFAFTIFFLKRVKPGAASQQGFSPVSVLLQLSFNFKTIMGRKKSTEILPEALVTKNSKTCKLNDLGFLFYFILIF